MPLPVALTGDRPTGPLHLGHVAGSFENRVRLQEDHVLHVLVADLQALTDNAGEPAKVRDNVLEVVADHLALGIDPRRSVICLQSGLPALSELSMLFLNLVTVSRLERNPTVRDEIGRRGFGRSVPAGFLCYPAAQAADIAGFGATVVPVGADQLPMIELAGEIVARANALAGKDVLPMPVPMLSATGRLPGIDGKAKASKSLGNAIFLKDGADAVAAKVRAMFTDPGHLKASDPGKVEGNVVFAYLDAFDQDAGEVARLKERYERGGLGDVPLKRRLVDVLEARFGAARGERARLAAEPAYLAAVLREGTDRAKETTSVVLARVREAFGILELA